MFPILLGLRLILWYWYIWIWTTHFHLIPCLMLSGRKLRACLSVILKEMKTQTWKIGRGNIYKNCCFLPSAWSLQLTLWRAGEIEKFISPANRKVFKCDFHKLSIVSREHFPLSNKITSFFPLSLLSTHDELPAVHGRPSYWSLLCTNTSSQELWRSTFGRQSFFALIALNPLLLHVVASNQRSPRLSISVTWKTAEIDQGPRPSDSRAASASSSTFSFESSQSIEWIKSLPSRSQESQPHCPPNICKTAHPNI